MSLYTHIESNKRRSLFLMILVIAGVITVVAMYSYWMRGDLFLPFVAAIFAIPSSLIGYYSGDKIALLTNKAEALPDEEAPDVHNLVENLAMTAGIPKPKIYTINSPALNAFATGRDPEHASIAVTTGLLQNLNHTELEGVIAHELSHIQNYDIRFGTIVAIFVGFVTILADLFLRASWFGGGMRSRDNDRNNNQLSALLAVVGFVLLILSPIITRIIQLAISRNREYLADASGALLTRYPEGLASALEKIAASSPLKTAGHATAHLYIANPFKPKSIANLFATHPPLEDRIRRLRERRETSRS